MSAPDAGIAGHSQREAGPITGDDGRPVGLEFEGVLARATAEVERRAEVPLRVGITGPVRRVAHHRAAGIRSPPVVVDHPSEGVVGPAGGDVLGQVERIGAVAVDRHDRGLRYLGCTRWSGV